MPVSFTERTLSLYVQLRQEEGPLDGMWEFPGGKIEGLETPLQAGVREFKEEVGLDISEASIKLFSHFPFKYKDRELLFFIHYLDASQVPEIKDVLVEQKISWENAKNDVESANIPDANKAFLMQFIDFKMKQLGLNT